MFVMSDDATSKAANVCAHCRDQKLWNVISQKVNSKNNHARQEKQVTKNFPIAWFTDVPCEPGSKVELDFWKKVRNFGVLQSTRNPCGFQFARIGSGIDLCGHLIWSITQSLSLCHPTRKLSAIFDFEQFAATIFGFFGTLSLVCRPNKLFVRSLARRRGEVSTNRPPSWTSAL